MELPRLEESIYGLVEFLSSHEDEETYQQNKTAVCEQATESLQSSLSHRFSALRKQADKTNNSLVANLSIHESRGGIAEAEGVTKLTELAFLFLPLTFSASIFSM